MLSQTEPHTNYHQQAIEYHRSLSSKLDNMQRLMEYDLTDLGMDNLHTHKKKLHQLSEFAKLSRIQIRFDGLESYKQKFEQLYCCTLFSQDSFRPELDMVQMLTAIQTQSQVSPRKYNINLIF